MSKMREYDGFTVFTSCFWQVTSAIVPYGEKLYLFDPGFFPHELEAIRKQVDQIRGDRELVLVLTHGDWDHIAGCSQFHEAAVVAHQEIVTEGRLEKQLAKLKQFDERYYVERSSAPSVPRIDHAIHAETERWGVIFIPVPGHTADQLATIFPEKKLMVAGDMLSNLEFPFVGADSAAYLTSLDRIEQLVRSGTVEQLVPGHGSPALASDEIVFRIERDRRYLLEARECIFSGVANGTERDQLKREFLALRYDGKPIGSGLLSAHEGNFEQIMSEATKGER